MIRELISHSGAYTFANLASRGTALIWLIVLPSFLSTADYGALGLILMVAALVNLVVPLEISQALARYYPPAEPPAKHEYVTTAWTFTLICLAIVLAAGLLFAHPLSDLLFGEARYRGIFLVAAGFFALNTSFYFVQNQFRWDFRPLDYTIVTLVFAIVTLSASISLAATLPDALAGVVLGQFLGAAVGLMIGVVRLRGTLALGLFPTRLRQMLRFSLPIVAASLALFVSTYASRFILRDLLDLHEVGLFTWASQVAAVPALLLLGVQGAITPLVMKHHADPETRRVIAGVFKTIVAIELLFCLAIGLFAPELILLLGYNDYRDAGPLVVVLAPAYLLLQLYVFSPGFAVAERTDLQLLVSCAAAIAAVSLNYLMIAELGLIGAAFATLASSSIFLGGWFLLSNRLYPVPFRWGKIGAYVLSAALCAAAGIQLGGELTFAAIATKLLLIAALATAAGALNLVSLGQVIAVFRRRWTPKPSN